MAIDNSPEWHLDDHAPEENALPEMQDEDYSPLTPEQKIASQKDGSRDHDSDTFESSGSGSSDLSTKEGSEAMFSSSSSSDAESGTYKTAKKYLLDRADGDEALQPNLEESEADTIDLGEKMKDVLYEEVAENVANYEVELKFAKEKLEASQEEIARMKYENLTLVEELGKTIEKLRASEDHMEKMEQKLRIEFQRDQNQLQDQLDQAIQHTDQLQTELASEKKLVSELQQTISKTTNDLNDYGREIDELKLALRDAQQDFSRDRSTFQSDITQLELRNKLLEEQIKQYEEEKVEARFLQEARESDLLTEINQLKVELSQRSELSDSLNKRLDGSKLKYDMLVAEKEELFEKVQTFGAEVNCRDNKIRQMEERVRQLSIELRERVMEAEMREKVAEELRLKVQDKETELEELRALIGDRSEEKREAIRQLCFSLEHYRNGYHELRQAFVRFKRPAVLAS